MRDYSFHTIQTGSTFSVASASGGAATTYNYLNACNSATDPPLDISPYSHVEFEIQCPAATGGATTPTLDVTIEASSDGINWWTLLTFAQILDTASPGESVFADREITPLGRYHRAKFVATTASGTETWLPVLTGKYQRA